MLQVDAATILWRNTGTILLQQALEGKNTKNQLSFGSFGFNKEGKKVVHLKGDSTFAFYQQWIYRDMLLTVYTK